MRTPASAVILAGRELHHANVQGREGRLEVRDVVSRVLPVAARLRRGSLSLRARFRAVDLGRQLVHLVHWLGMRQPDPNVAVPLWACYGIVGFLFAAVGGAVLYRGASKASEIQVPPKQTVESLKEIL